MTITSTTPQVFEWTDLHQAIPIDKFPEQARKFVDPSAPEIITKMMIDGLVPVPPLVRLCALYQIALSNPSKQSVILSKIQEIPSQSLTAILSQKLPASVLDWAAQIWMNIDDAMAALIVNTACADETMLKIAQRANRLTCERMVQNQARLLKQPSLVQVLYMNRELKASQADLLIEFAARNQIDLSWLPEHQLILEEFQQVKSGLLENQNDLLEEILALSTEEIPPENTVPLDQSLSVISSAQSSLSTESTSSLSNEINPNAFSNASQTNTTSSTTNNQKSPEEEKKLGIYGRLQRLNVSQKIRLALLGSQMERGILVKDSNKVVARAAIRSPSVSIQEALMYARNHSISAETIEYISHHKRWMQNYQVKYNIILNPKTPVSVSLAQIGTLNAPELKAITKSHSVPAVIKQKAEALIKAKSN